MLGRCGRRGLDTISALDIHRGARRCQSAQWGFYSGKKWERSPLFDPRQEVGHALKPFHRIIDRGSELIHFSVQWPQLMSEKRQFQTVEKAASLIRRDAYTTGGAVEELLYPGAQTQSRIDITKENELLIDQTAY